MAVQLGVVLLVACAASEEATEVERADVDARPAGLHTEAVAFDSTRERVVLFGGLLEDSLSPSGYRALGEVHEWDGARWHKPAVSSQPRQRSGAAMAYDPVRGVMLLAGGAVVAATDDSAHYVVVACPSCRPVVQLRDAWEYDGATWTQVGNGPFAHDAALVFHRGRGRMLLLGYHGLFGSDEALPTWIWERSDDGWMVTDSSGPRSSSSVRAAYDHTRGVIVLPILTGPDQGVWEWNGQWNQLQPEVGPEERARFVVTFDAARGEVVLFGGRNQAAQQWYNDLWSWDGAQWTRVHDGTGDAPTGREDGSLLYDSRLNRLILMGGLGPNQVLLRETWVFSAGQWQRAD